jgi:sialate O-acetylesterase
MGAADPGEVVSVSLGSESIQTQADHSGRWRVYLSSREAGGPHVLTIEGTNRIVSRNVLVGEVWVCSGQSNMQWPVSGAANAESEIATADWPDLRLFTVKKRISGKPLLNLEGAWSECTPETIPDFSAVAYFFGRDIHQKVGVPVGLIDFSRAELP